MPRRDGARRRWAKPLAQQLHARARAWQRYRLHVSAADLEAIRDDIVGGRAWKATGNTWYVWVKGQVCRVAYDRETKQVVTFLPQLPFEQGTGDEESGPHQS